MNAPGSDTQREEALIAACQVGDEQAFATLMVLYGNRLFGFFKAFGQPRFEAEDLVQETFVRIWRALPSYRHGTRFQAWVFCIAHNLLHDARRKSQGHQALDYREDIHDPGTVANPENHVLADELGIRLKEALMGLPEPQKRIFLLRQRGDLKFREIAEVLEIPLNTALSHMRRAVNALQNIARGQDESR